MVVSGEMMFFGVVLGATEELARLCDGVLVVAVGDWFRSELGYAD